VDIVLAAKEKAGFNENQVKSRIKSESRREVKITLCASKEDEGGVLITSKDGRTRFDNRFSALIKRNMDAMRLTVMKEVIENPTV
jgi:vacuolar-type H+-ATPase subunit E/Vma4